MTDSWMFPIDLTTMTSVMKMAPWQNLVSPSRWRLHGSFAAQMKGTIQGHLFRTKQAWMIHSRYFKTIFDHFETFMLGNAFGLVGSLSCFNSRIFSATTSTITIHFCTCGHWALKSSFLDSYGLADFEAVAVRWKAQVLFGGAVASLWQFESYAKRHTFQFMLQ